VPVSYHLHTLQEANPPIAGNKDTNEAPKSS